MLPRDETRSAGAAPWASVLDPIALLIFAAFLGLYVCTATKYNAFDAISYALRLRAFGDFGAFGQILHPHHLLHLPLGRILYSALRSMTAVDELRALQTLSAVCGASALALVYTYAVRSGASRVWALGVAVLLGGSRGFWMLATDGLPHMPAMLGFMLAMVALQAAHRDPTPVRWAAAGAAAALAALMHQSHLLITVPALAAFMMSRPRSFGNAASLVGSAVGVLGGAYALIPLLSQNTRGATKLYLWATQYARLGWWWDFNIARNARLDLDAFTRSAIQLPDINAAPPLVSFLGMATLACIIGLTACAFSGLFRRSPGRRLTPALIAGIAAYVAFFTCWTPGLYVFWAPVMTMVALVIAECEPEWKPRVVSSLLVSVTAALLLLTNAVVTIVPKLSPATNPYLTCALNVRNATHRDDVVIVAGTGYNAQAEVYIPYFTGLMTISLNSAMNRRGPVGGLFFVRWVVRSAIASGRRVAIAGDIMGCGSACKPLTDRYGVSASQMACIAPPQFARAMRPSASRFYLVSKIGCRAIPAR